MGLRNLFEPGSTGVEFSPAEIRQLLAVGEPIHAPAGTCILSRDEQGDCMYVIWSGSIEVQLADVTRQVAGRGNYFGELSFINPTHRRSASITALTDCSLIRLDQRSMQRLSSEFPSAVISLMRRTCSLLANKEESLSGLLQQKNRELEGTLDYLRRTREELDAQEVLARTDSLTGLYNRRCFTSQIGRFLTRSDEYDEGLALIYIDLDKFKQINDQLGHSAGDVVLVEVGKILRRQVRRTDLPVRIGGDEFAVVLLDVTAEQGQHRAEQIRLAISSMEHPGRAQGLELTASMGGTLHRPGESAAVLIARADRALYDTKQSGRNGLSWC